MVADWKSLFYYDESSPTCLRWAVDVFSGRHYSIRERSVGDVAGSVKCDKKHSSVKAVGKSFLVHRVIWEMFNGEIPEGMFVDHEDRVKVNNKINNLRVVTRAINNRNCYMRKDNTSGISGVSLQGNGNIWKASWQGLDGKAKTKGYSILKYGEAAKEMAIASRNSAISSLNAEGAGYTEHHGT